MERGTKNPPGPLPMDNFFDDEIDESLADDFPERACFSCGDDIENVQLEICRICFREFCADCAFKGPWGRFCSDGCNESFMYGADDEQDGREDTEGS